MSWEGMNRRKFPRANFPCLVKLSFSSDLSDAFLTHTENISTGGLCVILKRGLDLQTRVDLEIDLMDGENHILCQGKVVWVVRRKATDVLKPIGYDMGIEYVNITEDEVKRVKRIVEYIVKNEQRVML